MRTDTRQRHDPTTPPGDLRLRRDDAGGLVFRLTPEADPIDQVRLARCFPWSERDRYLSIRDKDGKELALIRDVEGTEAATRTLIEQELWVQEFIPHITAVESVDDRFEVTAWQVQTDRGPIELQVRSTDDIRQLSDQRILIKDHAGGLFEIVDLGALDAKSQQLVEDHMG